MATARDDAWDVLGPLSEPRRRAVYEVVCTAAQPVTREDVADSLGITRPLAAFHLDKLVDANLLDAENGPTPSQRRPKIGRPAKRYRRSAREVNVSVPARRYELAGRVLATTLAAIHAGEPSGDAARRIAIEEGRLLGSLPGMQEHAAGGADALGSIRAALEDLGYAPVQDADRLLLRNCPFSAIVAAAPHVTCEMNVALLEGLLAGLQLDSLVMAALQPQPGSCCVILTAVHAA